MKFNAALPAIAELKIVCVAFEGDRATVVAQVLSADGMQLHTVNVIVTDGKSQRLTYAVTTSYEKSFSHEVIDTPGLLTALKANIDGADDVLKGLFPGGNIS